MKFYLVFPNWNWGVYISPFFIFLFFLSCNRKDEAKTFEEFFAKTPRIALNPVKFEPMENSPYFINMYQLGYIDSVVIVNEFTDSEYTFKLIDLKSGNVKKFGKRGEGPNELISDGGYFLTDVEKNQLIIGDGTFNYVYDVKEIFDENISPINSFEFEISDDRFIGHRVFSEGNIFGSTYLNRFGIYNIENKGFEVHEDYPGGPGEALAHQAYFIAKPDKSKIAYGMRSYPEFGIIEFDQKDFNVMRWNWGEVDSRVEEYSDGTRAMLGSIDDKLHFFSTAGGKESVYFLHSGMNLREPNGQVRKKGLLPQVVYQLDWDGNPKAILDLGQDVKAIAVDPDENFLFASSSTLDPKLLIFKLPK